VRTMAKRDGGRGMTLLVRRWEGGGWHHRSSDRGRERKRKGENGTAPALLLDSSTARSLNSCVGSVALLLCCSAALLLYCSALAPPRPRPRRPVSEPAPAPANQPANNYSTCSFSFQARTVCGLGRSSFAIALAGSREDQTS